MFKTVEIFLLKFERKPDDKFGNINYELYKIESVL